MPTPDWPEGIPTTRLTGRYRAPNGIPLKGTVFFAPPSVLTLPEHDTIFTTRAEVPLVDGDFNVLLVATDAAGMSPAKWTYQVTEKIQGIPPRVYHILLPYSETAVDLADLAPISPYAGNYMPVVGPRGVQGLKGEPGEVTLGQLDALEARVAPRPQEHSQSAPSNEWTIPHSMPYRPAVNVYDNSGREIGGSVEYPSPTTVTVRFAYAETGSAHLH